MSEGGSGARHALRLLPSGAELECSGARTVLDACIDAGLAVPYNCRSGECGECMARLVAGEIEELPGADPAVFTESHRAAGNILACMCYPRSALVLDMPLRQGAPAIRPQTFHVMVDRVERLTPTILGVRVETPWAIDYRAGQCFEWIVPGIGPNRTYSAARPPGEALIDFHVRVYPGGKVGAFAAGLGSGSAFQLHGPFGNFGLSENDWRPAVCVAGGTGLAPILAALDAATARGDKRPVRLFYGARTQDELYALDRLAALAGARPRFEFIPVLSDEPQGSRWSGRRGFVSDLLEAELGDPFGAEAYVCGPPAMIDRTVEVLERAGLDPADIRTDRFVQAR